MLSYSLEFVSVEFVKNFFPYNMISDSAYLLVLIVFISEIGKEAIKEETQPINLGTYKRRNPTC